MSESSSFHSSVTHPRRRHNIHQFHVDIDSADTPAAASLVNFPKSHASLTSFNSVSSTAVPSVAASKKFDDYEERKKYFNLSIPAERSVANSIEPPLTHSFSNLSSLIAAPAAQFWNNAQNSFQALAEQYTRPLESETFQQPKNKFSSIEFEENFEPCIPVEMPYRDRTSEFRTVVKSTQLRAQPNGNLKNNDERERLIRSSIQFNQLARRIGRDLALTCAKMEKLTQMAKKKSLFQDHSGEMEELSTILKQDITGLNKQIANLQQMAVNQTGNSEAEHRGGKSQHSKLVVVGLQSKLADVSSTYKNVLEICTENMKQKRNRREKFSQPATLPLSSNSAHIGNSLLLHDDAMASGSSSVALDMGSIEQQRMQDQMSLIDGTQVYHQDRLGAMETIESSINELGTIFRQLASLVSEQGEMITRIDSNVEQSVLNVESGHHELLKYFNNISKNRWLIVKVFGVLMAFFIFFVVFMT